jgi:hypothetical protein
MIKLFKASTRAIAVYKPSYAAYLASGTFAAKLSKSAAIGDR